MNREKFQFNKVRSFRRRLSTARARRPRRKRRGRMRAFGVNKKRYLVFVPALLLLIVLTAFLGDPGRSVYRFRPAALTRVNPLMGWAIDASVDPGEVEVEHSLVYARLSWRDFEKEEGVYDFESFEKRNHLEHWWGEGKRLVLRFVMDQPGQEAQMDIPDWLLAAMGDDAGVYYENELGKGFSPNYANWLLMEKHRAAILKLGERYDGHQGVAFVELGSLGHDGGWTTEGIDNDLGMPPAVEFKSWVGAYTAAFPSTPLLASAPYQPARLAGLGLYNDNLGDEEATWDWLDTLEYGGFDAGAELRPTNAFYLTAPSGAHISPSINQRYLFGRGIGTLLRELRASHTTYVSGVDIRNLSEERIDQLSAAQSAMGYRLWVREASWPARIRAGYRLNVELDVRNDGAQAFSQPWPVQLSLYKDEELKYGQATDLDARLLAPGSKRVAIQIELPSDLESGEYRVGIAILDPHDGKAAVELAMSAPRTGLTSLLGTITVDPA